MKKLIDENLNFFLEKDNTLNYTYIELNLKGEKNFLFIEGKTEENLKELKLIKILIESSFSKKEIKKKQ